MQALTISQSCDPYNDGMQTGRPTTRARSSFGERVYAARLAAGLSQSDVATQLGLKQPSFAAWERDDVALRPDQIAQLATILNVSTDQLLADTAPKRVTGPAGRLRQVFERASKLSRTQQTKVAEFVEPFVERQEKTA